MIFTYSMKRKKNNLSSNAKIYTKRKTKIIIGNSLLNRVASSVDRNHCFSKQPSTLQQKNPKKRIVMYEMKIIGNSYAFLSTIF